MAKETWDPAVEALIAGFRKLAPAEKGFLLRDGAEVIDPVKFHQALELEIAGGPKGARARTGALRGDLEDYLKVLQGRSPEETKDPSGKA